MLDELGVGHVSVVRVVAPNDAGLERRLQLATKLTEERRRSYEHEPFEVARLALSLELSRKESSEVVLATILA